MGQEGVSETDHERARVQPDHPDDLRPHKRHHACGGGLEHGSAHSVAATHPAEQQPCRDKPDQVLGEEPSDGKHPRTRVGGCVEIEKDRLVERFHGGDDQRMAPAACHDRRRCGSVLVIVLVVAVDLVLGRRQDGPRARIDLDVEHLGACDDLDVIDPPTALGAALVLCP